MFFKKMRVLRCLLRELRNINIQRVSSRSREKKKNVFADYKYAKSTEIFRIDTIVRVMRNVANSLIELTTDTGKDLALSSSSILFVAGVRSTIKFERILRDRTTLVRMAPQLLDLLVGVGRVDVGEC